MKKIVGLTGGVATGKSTVSRYLKDLGAYVIDVDQIGHQLYTQPEVKKLIFSTFAGVEIDGEVSRSKLGEIVFSNSYELEKLNNIMYPKMRDVILSQVQEGINIVDMAILFESGFHTECDVVVTVVTSQENQIDRMIKRGYSKEKIKGMLESQLSQKQKSSRSDFIINNDETVLKLKKKVDDLFKYLLEN